MSILIKDMKMPTSCYDCNCFIRDSDGSDYCCLLMQDIEDNDKRDDDCPLVPAPPHGDLIDRDALKAAICSRLCIKSEKYLSPGEATIMNEIFFAPTIIPAEEGET